MDAVRAIVRREYGDRVALRVRRQHGGSVASCFRVDFPQSGAPSLFVKVADDLGVCELEANGLAALRAAGRVRVPTVHRVGRLGNTAYLIMEFIAMSAARAGDYAALGTAVGRLHAHRLKNADGSGEPLAAFGFESDNYIGATTQKNTPCEPNWAAFFKTNRLEYQLRLLRERTVCSDDAFLDRVQRVADSVDAFFDEDEVIEPSLLHGDLWQGNWGFTAEKEPVVFDPACYWGHSEADLAMMTLFGYLPDEFYAAYEKEMPRAKRFDERVPLYQLYHALNHYNMFGGGFQDLCEDLLGQLETTLRRRLS